MRALALLLAAAALGPAAALSCSSDETDTSGGQGGSCDPCACNQVSGTVATGCGTGGSSTSSSTTTGAGGDPSTTSSSTSTSTSSTGGQGGVGGIVPPECVVPADCPGVDNECRSRTCTAGVCGVDFVAAGTALPAQLVGDCATATCDGAGEVASEYDASDVLDDGNDCTDDACTPQGPTNAAKATGTPCVSGLCDQAAACVANIPVKCKLNGGGSVFVCGDGTGDNNVYWDASKACFPMSATPCYDIAQVVPCYCPAGTPCQVKLGLQMLDGTCQ